jgi:hypothetical protein
MDNKFGKAAVILLLLGLWTPWVMKLFTRPG